MRKQLLCGCLVAVTALLLARKVPAATYVVDDASDPLPITGTLTLRQAIVAANTAPGPHLIMFQIPFPGVQKIVLQSELPAITSGQVTIDGFTQPGATPGFLPPASAVLMIEIDGSLAGVAHGLIVMSSFNWIQGLAVKNFARDGIRIEGTPMGTNSNTLLANFVGMDASGTVPAGNCLAGGNIWAGVDVLCSPSESVTFCQNNVVTMNLISANHRCGVQISSCPPSDCSGNQVLDNYIGTDLTGMFGRGNTGTGVVLAEGTHDNLIHNNVISANGANGVDLTGNYMTNPPANTTHNHFTNNLIGLGSDGVQPLGNTGRGAGVGIFEINSFFGGFCNDNDFVNNTVAYNGMTAFSVWEHPSTPNNADENTLLKNTTYFNQGIGIDLGDDGMTLNDPGDTDTGANQQLNVPLITSALWASGGATAVTGLGPATSEVHLYRAQVDLVSGAEGDLWLGSVWPNALGNWSLVVNGLNVGDFVTAICLDWAGGGMYSNTSEYASPLRIQPGPSDVAGIETRRFSLALAGPNPFRTSTAFRYELAAAEHATLRIYSATGDLVRTLVDGPVGAGARTVQWDGRAADGRAVAAGVYYVVLDTSQRRTGLQVVRLD